MSDDRKWTDRGYTRRNAVTKRLDELTAVCVEHGIPHYEGSAAILRGWADVTRGMFEQGLAELRRGLAIHDRSPVGLRKAYYAAFQKIVADDVPIVFINSVPYRTAASKRLAAVPQGIWGPLSPFDEIHFR